MPKKKEEVFVCSSCGTEYSKWQGRCDSCGEWNSLKQFRVSRSTTASSRKIVSGKIEVVNLAKINRESDNEMIVSSQIAELDRVLGKGIVRGYTVDTNCW